MGKNTEKFHAKDCKGDNNIISLSSVLSKSNQTHIETHTVNADELREYITNLMQQREKRIKPLEQNLGALPYPLISSLTDEELKLLVKFFDSFENEKRYLHCNQKINL